MNVPPISWSLANTSIHGKRAACMTRSVCDCELCVHIAATACTWSLACLHRKQRDYLKSVVMFLFMSKSKLSFKNYLTSSSVNMVLNMLKDKHNRYTQQECDMSVH